MLARARAEGGGGRESGVLVQVVRFYLNCLLLSPFRLWGEEGLGGKDLGEAAS